MSSNPDKPPKRYKVEKCTFCKKEGEIMPVKNDNDKAIPVCKSKQCQDFMKILLIPFL